MLTAPVSAPQLDITAFKGEVRLRTVTFLANKKYKAPW